MPVSGGAGRSVSSTFWPLCTPRPTARVIDLSVRCASMRRIVGEGSAAVSRPGSVASLWPNTGFDSTSTKVLHGQQDQDRSRPPATPRPPAPAGVTVTTRRGQKRQPGARLAHAQQEEPRQARQEGRLTASAPAVAARHLPHLRNTARLLQHSGRARADAAHHRTPPAAGPPAEPRLRAAVLARLGIADAELAASPSSAAPGTRARSPRWC